MKHKLLPVFSIFAMFAGIDAKAQLTVKGSDSYVYVGNEYLFVNQDVNLDNGNIYLRKEGQLLQGTSVTARPSTNKGLGKLSVFVDTKPINAYGVTQFGIPVSNTSATATGSNAVTNIISGNVLYRAVPVGTTPQAVTFGTTPHEGLATSSSLYLSSRFIAWFGGAGAYSTWKYPYQGQTNIPVGYGVNVKGTNGSDAETAGETTVNKIAGKTKQRIDFRGLPNDGDINITVTSGNWYLLGNPYPSAFNLNQFIADNKDIIGNIYFYEDYSGDTHQLAQYASGYGVYTPGNTVTEVGTYVRPAEYNMYTNSGAVISDPSYVGAGANTSIPFGPFLPIGQGFWVEIVANGQIKFKNSQRVFRKNTENNFVSNVGGIVARTSGSLNSENWEEIPNLAGIDYTQFSKMPKQNFAISAKSTTGAANVALVFDQNSQNLYSKLEDTKADLSADFSIYFPKGEHDLMVSGQPFDISERIPMSIKSNVERVVEFDVKSTDFFNLSDEIYLHDKTTDTYYDIKSNVAQVTVPAGVTANKYEVTFRRDSQLSNDNEFLNNAFVVLQNNTLKQLTINNPEALTIAAAELFDIQGKTIFAKKSLGSDSTYTFSTSGLSDGVYIVKVSTSNGKNISKKVVIKN